MNEFQVEKNGKIYSVYAVSFADACKSLNVKFKTVDDVTEEKKTIEEVKTFDVDSGCNILHDDFCGDICDPVSTDCKPVDDVLNVELNPTNENEKCLT